MSYDDTDVVERFKEAEEKGMTVEEFLAQEQTDQAETVVAFTERELNALRLALPEGIVALIRKGAGPEIVAQMYSAYRKLGGSWSLDDLFALSTIKG